MISKQDNDVSLDSEITGSSHHTRHLKKTSNCKYIKNMTFYIEGLSNVQTGEVTGGEDYEIIAFVPDLCSSDYFEITATQEHLAEILRWQIWWDSIIDRVKFRVTRTRL